MGEGCALVNMSVHNHVGHRVRHCGCVAELPNHDCPFGSPHPARSPACLQAEHGPDSQAVLVALPGVDVETVQHEVERQCELLPRAETTRQALTHSCIVQVGSKEEAADFSNRYGCPDSCSGSIPGSNTVVYCGSGPLPLWAPAKTHCAGMPPST